MWGLSRGKQDLERKARFLIGFTLVVLLLASFVLIDRAHKALLFERLHERADLTAGGLSDFLAISGVDVNDLPETTKRLKAYMERIRPVPGYSVRLLSGRAEAREFKPEEAEANTLRQILAGESRWAKRIFREPSGLAYRYYVHLSGPAGQPSETLLCLSFPMEEERRAVWNFRATLLTTGVFTVLFALVVLYFLLRAAVVEPLGHLGEVSNRIRAGDLSARAEISTGDELEEFSHSFNQMVEHLENLNRDLDARLNELGQANLRLFEMNRLQGEFMAVMSHELRTPLNSIIGFSEVLQEQFRGKIDEKQEKFLAHILTSGRHLQRLVNEILDLAKIESGRMELRFEKISVPSVIQMALESIPQDARKGIRTETRIPEDLPPIVTDEARLLQILQNLLSNAYKFTPKGGEVRVEARSSDGKLSLIVKDTGIGIPPEEKVRIFEKFRQVDSSSTRGFPGAGLGLSIVKELSLLLGGSVSLESEPNKGSTFTLTLPLSPSR